MDYRKYSIISALLVAGPVFAGYAQLKPPVGWVAGGGAGGSYRVPLAAAANNASYSAGQLATTASIDILGRPVIMPAISRFAANAPRFAAAAIYAHPYIRVGSAIAAWLAAGALVYDVASNVWQQADPNASISDGYYYSITSRGYNTGGELTVKAAAQDWAEYYQAYQASRTDQYISWTTVVASISGLQVTFRNTYVYKADGKTYTNTETASAVKGTQSTCPAGWYVTGAGCLQTAPQAPVTQTEFVDKLITAPMPQGVPLEIPDPLPVDLPQISPVFVPTGNPYPNPSYDPSAPASPGNQPYIQPGNQIRPAPTVSDPWNVDIAPIDRPVATGDPNPDPVIDTGTGGSSGETSPPTTDLCRLHPDIVACQKMTQPVDPGALPSVEANFDFQVEGGFAGAGVCPAPLHFTVGGQVITWNWQKFCDQLSIVKPLLLAFAWLSAAFIMLGAKHE